VINTRRVRWAGNVARPGETRNAYKILVGDPGIDEGIILEWVLGKLGRKVWTVFVWLRIETSGGLL